MTVVPNEQRKSPFAETDLQWSAMMKENHGQGRPEQSTGTQGGSALCFAWGWGNSKESMLQLLAQMVVVPRVNFCRKAFGAQCTFTVVGSSTDPFLILVSNTMLINVFSN